MLINNLIQKIEVYNQLGIGKTNQGIIRINKKVK